MILDLTTPQGDPIAINIDNVLYFRNCSYSGVMFFFPGASVVVAETFEEVVDMLDDKQEADDRAADA